MRGFRGSRAAQGFNAQRFGHNGQGHGHNGGNHYDPHNEQGPKSHLTVAPNGVQLPEWMKTPETLEREKAAALAMKNAPAQQPIKPTAPIVRKPMPAPVAAKPAIGTPVARPQLSVIQGGGQKAVAKAPTAKTTTPSSTRTTTARRATAPKKTVIAKREVAPVKSIAHARKGKGKAA
jgi:hypothetical protein